MKKMLFLHQLLTAYTFSRKHEAPPFPVPQQDICRSNLVRTCGYRHTSCEVRSRVDMQLSKVRVQCCVPPHLPLILLILCSFLFLTNVPSFGEEQSGGEA